MKHRSLSTLGRWIPGVIAITAITVTGGCRLSYEPELPYYRIAYVYGSGDTPMPRIDAEKLTHINYAFAFIRDGEIVSISPRDAGNLANLAALRESNPNLRILISIGGWSGSEGFSDAALTDSSRQRFAESVIRFIGRHNLDGADVDWEYPGQPGAGNTHRPEDRENFTRLLTALREHMDQESNRTGRTYLLSIATATSPVYMDNTDLGSAHRPLDFINVMTYDFAGPWTDTVWHHTNLQAPTSNGSSRRGVDLAIDRHIRAGVPQDKLVIGVAFYGRGWTGVDGLNRPANDSAFSASYHDIAARYLTDAEFVRRWDTESAAPYLWNATSGTFLSYDDAESIREKAKFVKDMGLRGAMFWQYGSDTTGTLVNALYEDLR